jgi:hypothetical protein
LKRFDFPAKKDLVYWILIIITILAFISVWRTENTGTLLDDISLASTWLSILLAIAAIIFTFIQSAESSRQSFDMIKEINKLTSQIINLTAMKNDLSDSLKKQEKLVEAYNTTLERMINNSQIQKTDGSEEITKILWQSGKNIEKLQNESIFYSELPSEIVLTNSLKEKAISNFIKYNYEKGKKIHLQILWNNLYESQLRLSIEELRTILQSMRTKGIVELEEDANDTYILIQ